MASTNTTTASCGNPSTLVTTGQLFSSPCLTHTQDVHLSCKATPQHRYKRRPTRALADLADFAWCFFLASPQLTSLHDRMKLLIVCVLVWAVSNVAIRSVLNPPQGQSVLLSCWNCVLVGGNSKYGASMLRVDCADSKCDAS